VRGLRKEARAGTVFLHGPPMMSVDADSVQRMLWERGATATCASCGRNDWLTLPGGWTVELPVSEGAGSIPDVIVLGCRHCGLLRLHVDPATSFDPVAHPEKERYE
jgi:hypothetical protein